MQYEHCFTIIINLNSCKHEKTHTILNNRKTQLNNTYKKYKYVLLKMCKYSYMYIFYLHLTDLQFL